MRNGKEAVELAIKACELSNWKNWGIIDTLAAAYAEAGNFEQAINYQRQVMQMINSSGDDSRIKYRLALTNSTRLTANKAIPTPKATVQFIFARSTKIKLGMIKCHPRAVTHSERLHTTCRSLQSTDHFGRLAQW